MYHLIHAANTGESVYSIINFTTREHYKLQDTVEDAINATLVIETSLFFSVYPTVENYITIEVYNADIAPREIIYSSETKPTLQDIITNAPHLLI